MKSEQVIIQYITSDNFSEQELTAKKNFQKKLRNENCPGTSTQQLDYHA